MEFLVALEKGSNQDLNMKLLHPFSSLEKDLHCKIVDCQNESCLQIFNSVPLYLCIMKAVFILSHSHGLFL